MNKIDPTSAVIGGLVAALVVGFFCFIGWISIQVVGGTMTGLDAKVTGLIKEANPKFADHDKQLKDLTERVKKLEDKGG